MKDTIKSLRRGWTPVSMIEFETSNSFIYVLNGELYAIQLKSTMEHFSSHQNLTKYDFFGNIIRDFIESCKPYVKVLFDENEEEFILFVNSLREDFDTLKYCWSLLHS